MNAALIDDFEHPPRYGEIAPPTAEPDELLITVKAAALSNLVRGQANGSHYSSVAQFPLIPGSDGVGITPDGRRVYFIGRSGAMAEQVAIHAYATIPLPDTLDDITAAALGNPGIATWGALLGRAHLQPGEVVLINGATGITGRQAVQVAKYLGASRVIATGRNTAALESLRDLGADVLIPLTDDTGALTKTLHNVIGSGVNVVLDYLWGPSALAILNAAAGHGGHEGEPRIRFIQIGAISGNTIDLPANLLRSSGVEILGSGLGSLAAKTILTSLATMYEAAGKTTFVIETEAVPLRDITEAWTRNTGDRRLVFVP